MNERKKENKKERMKGRHILHKISQLLLYSLDSKPPGLLSKRGSQWRTSPLEIHYTPGAYFWEGAYYPDYTVYQYLYKKLKKEHEERKEEMKKKQTNKQIEKEGKKEKESKKKIYCIRQVNYYKFIKN